MLPSQESNKHPYLSYLSLAFGCCTWNLNWPIEIQQDSKNCTALMSMCQLGSHWIWATSLTGNSIEHSWKGIYNTKHHIRTFVKSGKYEIFCVSKLLAWFQKWVACSLVLTITCTVLWPGTVTLCKCEVDNDIPQQPPTFSKPFITEQKIDNKLDFLFLNSQSWNFRITDQTTNTPTLGKSTCNLRIQRINFYWCPTQILLV